MANALSDRAVAFFEDHVRPTVEAWRQMPLDLRLAMHAAVSLNQMADHFWHQHSASSPHLVLNQGSVGDFRRELAARRPNFGLIRDVADAHKHVKLNRPNRAVTSAGQTTVGSLGWGEAEWGVGKWGGGDEVVVELDSGRRRHFSAIVSDAMKMWETLLSGTAV